MPKTEAACVFLARGFWCFIVSCNRCAWSSHSADERWAIRAGKVHGFLCPGHDGMTVTRHYESALMSGSLEG